MSAIIELLRRADVQHDLAKALFEEEERRLPEGETWNLLTEGAQLYYVALVRSVIYRLQEIIKGEA